MRLSLGSSNSHSSLLTANQQRAHLELSKFSVSRHFYFKPSSMITTTTAPPPLMAILLALTLTIISTEAAEPPPALPSCGDELVRFSPCLPYVSSPPNNLSDSPPPRCCDAFSLSMVSGGALCICYLVQDPLMLGFPLNESRVLSLSSTCPLRDISTNTSSAQSLESLCSGSPELPPLRSSTISKVSPPPGFESVDNASSPLMSLAPESANTTSIPPENRLPTPPSSSVYPAGVSAAVKQIHKSHTLFLPALLNFFVSMFI